MRIITLSEKDIARFWSKVDIRGEDECWEWQGDRNKERNGKGYGRFSITSSEGEFKPVAHRVSWVIHFGNPTDELEVCHECDNRACCNPNHLFLGTQKENMQDMAKKGRTEKSLGEKHKNSRLKEKDIPEIRRLLGVGMGQRGIAKLFNVCQRTIAMIHIGKTWSWLNLEKTALPIRSAVFSKLSP